MKVLTSDGLLYYTQLLRNKFDTKADKTEIPSTIVITPNSSNVSLALSDGTNTGTAVTFPAVDSTNAGLMTPTMLSKLNGIAASAEVNVIETVSIQDEDSGGNMSITLLSPSGKNVTIPLATTSQSGLISHSDKTKLNGIASGAEVNVQSDWNQTTTTADDYIKNKPTIPQVLNAPYGNETDAAPSVYWVDSQLGQINGHIQVDGTSIDKNADEELYVKQVSADKIVDGTTNKAYTATEKTKLSGIEAGAQVNVIEHIKLGSQNTDLEITSKGVTIPVDTVIVNNSTNPTTGGAVYSALLLKASLASPIFTGTPKAPTAASGTNSTQIATTAFVQAAISAAVTGSFKFVNSLPTTGEEGYIYLVPHTHSGSSTNTNPDVKDEYIWNTSASPAQWELIGNTDLDLSNYWNTTDLVALTTSEITTIWNTGMSND